MKITRNTPADSNTKDVEIAVSLKQLRNFARTFEIQLINFEINLQLKYSSTCFIANSTGAGTSAGIYTKLCVPLVTFSTKDNAKLLQQLKSDFKRTINGNENKSEPKSYDATTPYLDRLIDPSFSRVNRPFVLSFENSTDRTCYIEYYLPKVEKKNYNVKISGRSLLIIQ